MFHLVGKLFAFLSAVHLLAFFVPKLFFILCYLVVSLLFLIVFVYGVGDFLEIIKNPADLFEISSSIAENCLSHDTDFDDFSVKILLSLILPYLSYKGIKILLNLLFKSRDKS